MNKPTAGARTVRELKVGSHPLQLYSMATPNGQKVTVALEEMGLKYDAWFTNIMEVSTATLLVADAVLPGDPIGESINAQAERVQQPSRGMQECSPMLSSCVDSSEST